MNTALPASPPTETTRSARNERDLSIQLPHEEELRNLSFAQRLALRVALHLILRARPGAHSPVQQALAYDRRRRVLEEHEASRLSHTGVRPVL